MSLTDNADVYFQTIQSFVCNARRFGEKEPLFPGGRKAGSLPPNAVTTQPLPWAQDPLSVLSVSQEHVV